MTFRRHKQMSIPTPDLELSGWTVLPGFLDQAALEAISAGLGEVLRLPRPSCMNRPGNDLVPLRWCDAIVGHVLGSRQRTRRLGDLLRSEDLKWLSGYVSSKAPHSPALWWHQDWWCWDHPISFRRAAVQVAVLCYLQDTDRNNGALRVLPGSHHKSAPMHALLPELHGEHASRLPLDHPAMMESPDQLTVPVRAGDAVVLDYRLLHGTYANDTPHRRDCLLLSFIPNWRGLPSEIEAHFALHPALPNEQETASSVASAYADLLPRFFGTPTSMSVNRIAPTDFRAG